MKTVWIFTVGAAVGVVAWLAMAPAATTATGRLAEMEAQLALGTAPATGNIFVGEPTKLDQGFLDEYRRLKAAAK